jgi:hypothetical protein
MVHPSLPRVYWRNATVAICGSRFVKLGAEASGLPHVSAKSIQSSFLQESNCFRGSELGPSPSPRGESIMRSINESQAKPRLLPPGYSQASF